MQIKYRNMFAQILLMIVTLGLYSIYWFYQTSEELKFVAQDQDARPGLWTVALFIPFGFVYSYFKYAELFQKAGKEKIHKGITFLLYFFFAPAVWFLVQTDLNERSRKELKAA